MVPSLKHVVDGFEKVVRDLPFADDTLGTRLLRRPGDDGLFVGAEQDHLQPGQALAETTEEAGNVSLGEREVHDREGRAKSLDALAERPLVRHHHHRIELRAEKRPDPFR